LTPPTSSAQCLGLGDRGLVHAARLAKQHDGIQPQLGHQAPQAGRPQVHVLAELDDLFAAEEQVVTGVEVDLPDLLAMGPQRLGQPLEERPHRTLQKQRATLAEQAVEGGRNHRRTSNGRSCRPPVAHHRRARRAKFPDMATRVPAGGEASASTLEAHCDDPL
jgi:hypothetical protein